MSTLLNIALAQLNFTVGAIEENTEKVLQAAAKASQDGADLIVFPELALTGYPIDDLVYRPDLYDQLETQLKRIALASADIAIAVGHPESDGERFFNTLSVYAEGKRLRHYHKQVLPNYGVFDEKRYFTAGDSSEILKLRGGKLAC